MALSDLIERIDIVDYISQYVELTLNGDEYWGVSPFTFPPEKTPSFSVRKSNQSFYDFSSGIGGNVFTFVKYYNKCSGYEAVKKLEEYAGVDGTVSFSHSKMAATEACKKYIHKNASKKKSKTTILQENHMERYTKDYDKLRVWIDEGISKEVLDKFQVLYDEFSDRIVYPIRNPDGKIVNVGGRTVDPEWKAKNLRKYCYFYQWGTIETIYGLYEAYESAKKAHEIILFEGCKSVLIANTWGITNVGALLTSHLSKAQMKLLASLGCRVVFALDKDVDITKDRHIKELCRYVNVEYVKDISDALDAKDAPVDKGKEVFISLYNSRKRYK